jgi:gas vesicle protein
VKKILTAVVGALVVVGAGAGLWIALDSSKSAATIGKTKISTSQLNETVKAVIAERKTVSTTGMTLAYGDSLNAEELNYYVVSTLLAHTMAANKLTITDAQIKERSASILKQVGSAAKLKSGEVSAGIASKDFPGYVREILSIEALTKMVEAQGTATADSGTAVQGLVRQMGIKEGVKIDPKYGTWDSTQVSVVPPATAASTSPTPAASK